jgi:hypothetical protein
MKTRINTGRCPHLKEIAMVLCEASPVKKMLPLEGTTTCGRCFNKFNECPFFAESAAETHFPLAKKLSDPRCNAES